MLTSNTQLEQTQPEQTLPEQTLLEQTPPSQIDNHTQLPSHSLPGTDYTYTVSPPPSSLSPPLPPLPQTPSTWYLTTRRLNCWMGSATHSYRGFITAVTNNDVREVIVTIHEQEFVNPAFQGEYSGVIAANIVRSACSYWGSRPTDVSIIPCHGGSFRPESCRVLGRELKGMLTPNVLETVGCVPLVEFKEQDVGGLRGYKSSGTVLDDEFYVAMSNACRIFDVCERRMGMEGQMSRRVRGEVRGNGMEKYSRRGLGGWWEACGGVWAKGWG